MAEVIDAKYPDWQAVFSKSIKAPSAPSAIRHEYIGHALRAEEILTKPPRGYGHCAESLIDTKGDQAAIAHFSDDQALALIMPMRADPLHKKLPSWATDMLAEDAREAA